MIPFEISNIFIGKFLYYFLFNQKAYKSYHTIYLKNNQLNYNIILLKKYNSEFLLKRK